MLYRSYLSITLSFSKKFMPLKRSIVSCHYSSELRSSYSLSPCVLLNHVLIYWPHGFTGKDPKGIATFCLQILVFESTSRTNHILLSYARSSVGGGWICLWQSVWSWFIYYVPNIFHGLFCTENIDSRLKIMMDHHGLIVL